MDLENERTNSDKEPENNQAEDITRVNEVLSEKEFSHEIITIVSSNFIFSDKFIVIFCIV
jgi:hypothetical protein